MPINNRSLQIITRRANQRILIDQQLTVTIVEISDNEVTLEIAGRDGDAELVTLRSNQPVDQVSRVGELVCC